MTAKPTPRGLGRGLAALLGDGPIAERAADASGLRQIAIDLIDPNPHQPRTIIDRDALEELADSIRHQGILQPLLLRSHPEMHGRFQLVAGERRWRAAALAGLHEVPAVIRELTDRESAVAALVENLQREDLNAMEKAESIQRLDEEFGLSREALADALGKSRPYVGNFLRLLKLPSAVQDLVRKDQLSYGHARALVDHPEAEELAHQIINKGMSVRQAEMLVLRQPKKKAPATARQQTPDLDALTDSIARDTGYQVRILMNRRGGGAMTIKFANLMQLEELVEKIRRDVAMNAAAD